MVKSVIPDNAYFIINVEQPHSELHPNPLPKCRKAKKVKFKTVGNEVLLYLSL